MLHPKNLPQDIVQPWSAGSLSDIPTLQHLPLKAWATLIPASSSLKHTMMAHLKTFLLPKLSPQSFPDLLPKEGSDPNPLWSVCCCPPSANLKLVSCTAAPECSHSVMSQKRICYIIIIYSLLNSVLKLQPSELPWSAHTRLFHPTKFISVCLSEKEPQQPQHRPDLRGEKAGVGEKKRGKK